MILVLCDILDAVDRPLPAVDTDLNKTLQMDPTASDSSLQKTSPPQDPAVLNQLFSEVSAQASMLAAHHQHLQKLTSLTEELVRTLQTLHVVSPPPNPTPPAPAPANHSYNDSHSSKPTTLASRQIRRVPGKM